METEVKDCLEAARAAITDAIGCEDGLDGATGETVIKWITDILGDYQEWHKSLGGEGRYGITIGKAIEILTEWHWPDLRHPWRDTEAAIKLGIEALKAIRDLREPISLSMPSWLPSETET